MIDSLLSECLLVSNNTFKLQVEKLKEFVTDEQWREILIFDMSLNPKLAAKIVKYIDIINFNKISTINIERIIKKIRKDTLKLIEEASLVEDTVSKWLKYREVYAHYGFLETINEGSKITDYIFNDIKNKYGSKYLSVLEVVDNLNPSELTNLTKNQWFN